MWHRIHPCESVYTTGFWDFRPPHPRPRTLFRRLHAARGRVYLPSPPGEGDSFLQFFHRDRPAARVNLPADRATFCFTTPGRFLRSPLHDITSDRLALVNASGTNWKVSVRSRDGSSAHQCAILASNMALYATTTNCTPIPVSSTALAVRGRLSTMICAATAANVRRLNL